MGAEQGGRACGRCDAHAVAVEYQYSFCHAETERRGEFHLVRGNDRCLSGALLVLVEKHCIHVSTISHRVPSAAF